ncbi:MAG: hypothetical protein JWO51_2786 [Rhodospirillales bacterium]|nr:hypothetical protein [Rhodospirillales bacterium]
MRRHLAALLLALAIAGCSAPVTSVNTVDERPHLQFVNASPTAILVLDGGVVGPAAGYDGKTRTLALETGSHRVEIRDGARTVYADTVYLGGDMTKTINLPD